LKRHHVGTTMLMALALEFQCGSQTSRRVLTVQRTQWKGRATAEMMYWKFGCTVSNRP
jgi:hypothetical protein